MATSPSDGDGWSDGDDGGSRLHGARALPTAGGESKGGDGQRRHRGSFYRGNEAAAKAHGDRRREGKIGEKRIRIKLESAYFQRKLTGVSIREKEEEIEEIISP